jgi:hypothetical protein
VLVLGMELTIRLAEGHDGIFNGLDEFAMEVRVRPIGIA